MHDDAVIDMAGDSRPGRQAGAGFDERGKDTGFGRRHKLGEQKPPHPGHSGKGEPVKQEHRHKRSTRYGKQDSHD